MLRAYHVSDIDKFNALNKKISEENIHLDLVLGRVQNIVQETEESSKFFKFIDERAQADDT